MQLLIRFVFRTLSPLLAKRHLYLTTSLKYLKRKRLLDVNRIDYMRISSLELAAFEIYRRGVLGAVAEVGVYKGDFARHINRAFKDRTFYLFDTFTGFDDRDRQIESQKNFSAARQDFSGTSVNFVLSRMENPERCQIRKGFFPQTAEGISDSFAFVSLDADLYEPIYQGLLFFYPKLSSGGYIFIHDFNNDEYPGAREAVLQFCKEKNLSFVPVADDGGTVILTK